MHTRRTASFGAETYRAVLALSFTLPLAALSCASSGGGSSDDEGFAGTYLLERRDGHALPHAMPYARDGHDCRSVLLRDVLVLHPDSTFEETVVSKHWCDPQPEPGPEQAGSVGRVRFRGVRGDTIELVDTVQVLNFTQVGALADSTLHLVANGPGFARPIHYDYRRAR
jgi:hypothetical protein